MRELFVKLYCLSFLCLLLHSPPEKDTNGDVLWVWAYPSVDPAFRELLMRKCTLTGEGEGGEEEGGASALEFSYGHIAEAWYYLFNQTVEGVPQLDKVR